jgi:bifunctional UDP-N-acetylglucosamine pyrophosphorylase / glucosamine-1-phosphate N-acetyltransferase
MKTTAVLMAAGLGTRMKSATPKVLHHLLGRALISYAVQAVTQATGGKPVVVVGHAASQVQQVLAETALMAIQESQLGTGHAVQQAESLLRGKTDLVLIMAADMPLVSPQTLERLVELQQANPGPLSLLTVFTEDSHGFGRIIRDASGTISAIVEEAVATPEQLAIRELNAGIYCVREAWLWPALRRIPLSVKGEYYLTDLVEIAAAEGLSVQAVVSSDAQELIGINTRVHLAEAESILRQRVNEAWMLAGVTILDPASTYIEADVQIGQDTVIWPNTYLQASSQIGTGCSIGPNAILRGTRVGERCKVFASVLEGAVLEDDVEIGPFSHLRKGAYLSSGVHIGNFGEIKNSTLAPGVKMGHFSYIGDATIGEAVNIGAGTITCNFGVDRKKRRTEIGKGAFIGSDTLLVAPVKIGEKAVTGSGAVVTKDVPPRTVVVGVPARELRKIEEDE